eukprot:10953376-Prorocentrum_lima.AAC.1
MGQYPAETTRPKGTPKGAKGRGGDKGEGGRKGGRKGRPTATAAEGEDYAEDEEYPEPPAT